MRPFDPSRDVTCVEVMVALLSLEHVPSAAAHASVADIARTTKRPNHVVRSAVEKLRRLGFVLCVGRSPMLMVLTALGRAETRRLVAVSA